MANLVVRVIMIVSLVICLIVIASFAIFAVGETKSASNRQQESISGASGQVAEAHESELHKAIDDASEELTSPWAGIVSDSSGEWAVRIVNLVIALAVYGFGLGYLARMVRVRV
ncbi:MAG TPA: hypothetical protein VFY36_00450 [Solirubrobacteraceae bacterium]|nr:hypothetical protein [Solirubrobacteraceae bacterium]